MKRDLLITIIYIIITSCVLITISNPNESCQCLAFLSFYSKVCQSVRSLGDVIDLGKIKNMGLKKKYFMKMLYSFWLVAMGQLSMTS